MLNCCPCVDDLLQDGGDPKTAREAITMAPFPMALPGGVVTVVIPVCVSHRRKQLGLSETGLTIPGRSIIEK